MASTGLKELSRVVTLGGLMVDGPFILKTWLSALLGGQLPTTRNSSKVLVSSDMRHELRTRYKA